LADALRLIGDALEPIDDRHQRGDGLERELLATALLDDLGVQGVTQPVDALLGFHGLAGEGRVLREESLDGAVKHRNREIGDLAEALDGDGHVHRGEGQDLARDALGVVPDALELGVDLDRDVREAERAGDRLLPDDELQA
jgi:hypothetical protein